MNRTLLLAIVTVLGGVYLSGCSGGDAVGGDVPATVTNELEELSTAAKRAGGDYAKLTPEEQQKFVTRTGSEEGAKAMVSRMATPPKNMGGGK